MKARTSDSHRPTGAAGKARGGKAVYGANVGMLLLETRFARIPGDGGNAETWPFPVLWRVVSGAIPDRRATGLPVYDFHRLVCWFQAGLRPRRFDP